jgi:hypothetical protein
MAKAGRERRLTTIMAADIVGYSRLRRPAVSPEVYPGAWPCRHHGRAAGCAGWQCSGRTSALLEATRQAKAEGDRSSLMAPMSR